MNPLIVKKINAIDVPDDIKNILHEILNMEEVVQSKGEQRNASNYMSRVLEKYADNEIVVRYCEGK